MTENNKVSVLAFSVLVFGMLGFCVALAVDLFFSPGAPAAVAPATPTLPQELQDKVMLDRARTAEGIRQNFHFNVMGRGQVLPGERTQRVDEVICYHISFEHASTLSQLQTVVVQRARLLRHKPPRNDNPTVSV